MTVSIQEKTLTTGTGEGSVRKAPRTAHSIDVTGDRNKVEGSGIFVHITTVSDTHTDTAAVSAVGMLKHYSFIVCHRVL